MLTKITMPSGGQTTDRSMITTWHKAAGDRVKKGDVLFEMETDKATMNIESFAEGILLQVLYPAGEYVLAGEAVAYIGEEGDMLPQESAAGGKGCSEAPEAKETQEYRPIMPSRITTPQSANSTPTGARPETARVLASPAARAMAREKHADLEEIAQKMPGKVLKRADVAGVFPSPAAQETPDVYYVDTTPMRRTIARRMKESLQTAPGFTVSVEVDMTASALLRKTLDAKCAERGIKIAYGDILMKCAAKAIGAHPFVNATYSEDRIRISRSVHFGLAVGLPGGLVVPVVREVEKKSIPEIAEINRKNVEKAKNGSLLPEEMSGGTITLSNLGMYGVSRFTAILNQPESCILAVGGIADRAVVRNGEVAIRPMMDITATFDHRTVDGAEGAAFLKDLKELLENPQLLLL